MESGGGFLDRLWEVAAEHPEQPAVITAGTEVVTYRKLLGRADRIAAGLVRAGVRPEQLVGLGLPRSAEFVAAAIGCWRTGAAFLPLDARWPTDRLEFIVRDSGLLLAVAVGPQAAELRRLGVTTLDPDAPFDLVTTSPIYGPNRLAYAVYTSGSTGRPKGVLVEHRGIVNLLDAQIAAFDLTPGSRALWVLSPAFDASVSDIGTALLAGATLCVEPDDDLRDPVRLIRLLRDRAITHVDLPPALLGVLDPAELPPSLRTVVIGGEPAPAEAVRRWAARVRVVNVYGPTEATVCTSLGACDPVTWADPLLGRPIPGIRYQVLDDEWNPVPPGGVGELFITGVGLARGYLNRPDLTAVKFPTVRGERWYRTGDRVRRRPDGEFVFVGRADRQFKLRGQLVEPGEVEARLLELPGVREAAVVRRAAGDRVAIVAVVAASDEGLSATAISEHLARTVPPWMVPQRVEFLPTLPRTTAGKVDYPALEAERSHPSGEVRESGGSDSREGALLAVWSAVLGRPADPAVGFLEQGGDSLGVLQVVAAAHARGLTLRPSLVANGLTASEIVARLRAGPERDALPAAFLEAEAAAELSRLPSSAPARGHPAVSPGRILLTGATGFLGSWLLSKLLARNSAEIHCLVRGAGRLPPDPRVHPIIGDLERPRFGLSAAAWDELTDRIDAVYHCAAAVDVVRPFHRLRAANLGGTAAVLGLVGTGRPKRLHYASTLSVFVSTDRAHGLLREDDDLTATGEVYGGYAQTKWAAERLLRLSGGRFGPVAHYRLGLITGDTRTGRGPGRDLFTQFIRGLARVGGYPAGVGELSVDITPVDYAAAAMARLSLAEHWDGATFHLANSRSLSLAELLDAVRASGVRLDPLSMAEFRARAAGLDPSAAAGCLGLCRALPGEEFDQLRATDLFQATGVSFDQTNTTATLGGSGIACPPPEPELIRKYVAAALDGIDR
ncbi:peptide synthetase [Limnoglobus roseus]|uniref:Peptide synthetase n=2 Tax=Limnoglobus roseus TaxID=2598579 RepID=A0A5C1AC50_9BACT|nr:peptide synthetase [Limnoglobus roseus]